MIFLLFFFSYKVIISALEIMFWRGAQFYPRNKYFEFYITFDDWGHFSGRLDPRVYSTKHMSS